MVVSVLNFNKQSNQFNPLEVGRIGEELRHNSIINLKSIALAHLIQNEK